MTGLAVVTSPHAYAEIRRLFIEEYLSQEGTLSFNVKNAWQTLAVCKAAVEIASGNKRSSDEISADMPVKYQRWSSIICEEPEGCFSIDNLPSYINEQLFMTTDVKGTKPIEKTLAAGKKLTEVRQI